MEFKLENKYLRDSIELMRNLPLSGYQSVARTRFVNVLLEPLQSYVDRKNEMIDEFVMRDSNGEPVQSDDGNGFKIASGKETEFATANTKLSEQYAEIDKGTYTDHEKDIKEILKNLSQPLAGGQADAYAALCDALSVDFKD